MSDPNSIAVVLVSFVALSSPSCVLSDGTDREDSAWEDTASEGLSEDAVLAQDADGALESSAAYVPASATPYSCEYRYCIYGLNGDSSISFYDCFQAKAEADAYKDSHTGWKVVAGFDTQNTDWYGTRPECRGTIGNVRFMIREGADCTPDRKYEIPSLIGGDFGEMNDTFVSAGGEPVRDRVRPYSRVRPPQLRWHRPQLPAPILVSHAGRSSKVPQQAGQLLARA